AAPGVGVVGLVLDEQADVAPVQAPIHFAHVRIVQVADQFHAWSPCSAAFGEGDATAVAEAIVYVQP
ncbi:hypothetical protein B7939_13490, partial [Eggerthia catenaformis]